MQIDNHTAIIDNDFLGHLAESSLTDTDLIDVLRLVFSELGLCAVMHPLVYDNEVLKDKARIKLLFDKDVVCRADFADILQGDPGKKAHYIYLVTSLYHTLMGEHFPARGDAVFDYWVKKKSLGEVHSFAMCLLCGCGIFLSDDGDSKRLKQQVKRVALDTVDVYNRKEFFEKHMEEGQTKLVRHTKRALTHTS